ncbi:MAG: hypothetical protein ABEJ62_00585 [Candidatus Nanohaloarchaea archaeon]
MLEEVWENPTEPKSIFMILVGLAVVGVVVSNITYSVSWQVSSEPFNASETARSEAMPVVQMLEEEYRPSTVSPEPVAVYSNESDEVPEFFWRQEWRAEGEKFNLELFFKQEGGEENFSVVQERSITIRKNRSTILGERPESALQRLTEHYFQFDVPQDEIRCNPIPQSDMQGQTACTYFDINRTEGESHGSTLVVGLRNVILRVCHRTNESERFGWGSC